MRHTHSHWVPYSLSHSLSLSKSCYRTQLPVTPPCNPLEACQALPSVLCSVALMKFQLWTSDKLIKLIQLKTSAKRICNKLMLFHGFLNLTLRCAKPQFIPPFPSFPPLEPELVQSNSFLIGSFLSAFSTLLPCFGFLLFSFFLCKLRKFCRLKLWPAGGAFVCVCVAAFMVISHVRNAVRDICQTTKQ